MSGSGGGSFTDDTPSSCESLVVNTQISSPKTQVTQNIVVGTILEVAVEQTNNVTIVVVKHQNQTAGGVASPVVQRLRECIQQGTVYRATVTAVNGPQISIRIEAS